MNYTVSDKDIKDIKDIKSILLINCDTRNEEFAVRIQLERIGEIINIDTQINLEYIKSWMSKVKKQDKKIHDNYYRVVQSIKEKFRLDNVLSDIEIDVLEKEKDDALHKFDIEKKKFERMYCGSFEEWHRCGRFDRWVIMIKIHILNYMINFLHCVIKQIF